jgi:hypothetical protein
MTNNGGQNTIRKLNNEQLEPHNKWGRTQVFRNGIQFLLHT